MRDCDVAIVGAGVAGLAAAAALAGSGLRAVVFEASDRLGGRAHTTHPAALGGAMFDRGASWLHAAGRNKLAPLAEAAGIALRDSDADHEWRVRVGGRDAGAADLAAHGRTEARYADAVRAALAGGADPAMAAAVEGLADDPWLATVETFECRMVAAADPRELSARDWLDNELSGRNLLPEGGVGGLVARCLGGAEMVFGAAVERVEWGGEQVVLGTTKGGVTARAVVVTASTGVLRAEKIAFAPGLPASHAAALDGLPMGLLTKVAIPDPAGARFGLPAGSGLSARVERRHAPAMFFLAGPAGASHVVGFVGGDAAQALARDGEAATAAFAVAQLRSLLGREVAVGPVVVADWAAEPWALGAYAYARPGHAGARRALAQPLAGGSLVFAGEAVAAEGLAGTVGGAYASGVAAAATVRKRLR